ERKPAPPDLGNSHQVLDIDPQGRKADFDRLAEAMGVPNSVFQNVDGRYGLEQLRAAAMNQALWPATLGYFMDQMMRPAFPLASRIFTQATIDNASAYFRKWVRGRGPAPAFRIGSVPYGVLPVVSLTRWAKRTLPPLPADPDEELEDKMVRVVRRLREIWKQGQRPDGLKIATSNSLDPLTQLLSEDASSLTVRLRDQIGGATSWNSGGIFGAPVAQIFLTLGVTAEQLMAQAGLPGNKPRVLTMVFKD